MKIVGKLKLQRLTSGEGIGSHQFPAPGFNGFSLNLVRTAQRGAVIHLSSPPVLMHIADPQAGRPPPGSDPLPFLE